MTQLTDTVLTDEVDDAIEQRVRAIREFSGGVYVGKVPDSQDIPTDSRGNIQPYAVIFFGGLIQAQGRYRGIVGTRQNTKYHTFMVLVVGSTDRQSRLLANKVRDVLEGLQLSDHTGEISEETSGNTRYPGDSTLKPTRYTQMLAFSLLMNP